MNASHPRVSRRMIVAGPVIALTAAFAFGGCDVMPLYKAERSITVPHVTEKAIDVMTHNGAISVVREEREDVSILAKIAATSQERADATTISAERREDGTLVVRAVWPENKRYNNEQAAFEVKTPGATGVTIESHNGELRIERLAGEARLTTHNGEVHVVDQAGRVLIETHNGKVEVRNVAGDVAVETHNGEVRVEEASGSALLRTHNGAVRADQVGGAVDAETHNGEMRIALTSDNAGPVEASTNNGQVTLVVGPAFVGIIKAETNNGSISHRDLPNARVVDSGKRHLHLSFGDGQAVSNLHSDNGAIHIRGR